MHRLLGHEGPPILSRVCPLLLHKSRDVDHCGLCGDFPCDDLINHYNKNNPHGQRNAVTRAGVLAYLSKHGDEQALELLRKLGKPPSP